MTWMPRSAGTGVDDDDGAGESGFGHGKDHGRIGFDEADAGMGLETVVGESGFGLDQVAVGFVAQFVGFGHDEVDLVDFESGVDDFVDSFGSEIADGVEGGSGYDGGLGDVAVGFVGFVLDELVEATEQDLDLDETGVDGWCLETASGFREGRFGHEQVALGLDNVVADFVDECVGFDLDKHAKFDLDDPDTGGVDVLVEIGHSERVSSPRSSP